MQVATQWGRVLPRPQRCCSCLRRIGTAPAPSTVLLSCAGAAAVPANVCDTLFVLHGSGRQWLRSWCGTESVPSRRTVGSLSASSLTGKAYGGTRSGTGLSIGRWRGARNVASPMTAVYVRLPPTSERGEGERGRAFSVWRSPSRWHALLCESPSAAVRSRPVYSPVGHCRGRVVCGAGRGECRQPPRLHLVSTCH